MINNHHRLINFIPWHKSQYLYNKKILLVSVTISIAVALCVACYSIGINSKRLDIEEAIYKKLQTKYRQTIVQELNFLPQDIAIDKVDALHQDIMHSKNRLHELQLLAQIMPPALWLSAISYDDEKITIAGFSSKYETMVRFTELLDESKLFYNAQLQKQQEHDAKNGSEFRFTVTTQGKNTDGAVTN